MEFASHGSLFHEIQNRRYKKNYFEEDQVWKIFLQLVIGLDTVHNSSQIHNYLKVLVQI